MLVYRIEDVEGAGMYYSTCTEIGVLPGASKRHPMPWHDSQLVENGIKAGIAHRLDISEEDDVVFDIRGKYLFGFATIEQLRSWLYDDKQLSYLHGCGLTLNVYDVPDSDVIVGHTQVVFVRSNEVTKHSIAEYFNLN